MNKKYLYLGLIFVIIGIFVFIYRQNFHKVDYKNATYIIDGQSIILNNGYTETEIYPQSSSKIATSYFGNELITDLNDDGLDDVVFIVTQQTGGSGNFYYVVGAINTGKGYVGSDGYFIGDRVAPQTIEDSKNPNHKNVIVINYADRKDDEPFSVQPSIGKSVYLKMDKNNRWGIVVNDFEGESR